MVSICNLADQLNAPWLETLELEKLLLFSGLYLLVFSIYPLFNSWINDHVQPTSNLWAAGHLHSCYYSYLNGSFSPQKDPSTASVRSKQVINCQSARFVGMKQMCNDKSWLDCFSICFFVLSSPWTSSLWIWPYGTQVLFEFCLFHRYIRCKYSPY